MPEPKSSKVDTLFAQLLDNDGVEFTREELQQGDPYAFSIKEDGTVEFLIWNDFIELTHEEFAELERLAAGKGMRLEEIPRCLLLDDWEELKPLIDQTKSPSKQDILAATEKLGWTTMGPEDIECIYQFCQHHAITKVAGGVVERLVDGGDLLLDDWEEL
jgi:hypothetical protein